MTIEEFFGNTPKVMWWIKNLADQPTPVLVLNEDEDFVKYLRYTDKFSSGEKYFFLENLCKEDDTLFYSFNEAEIERKNKVRKAYNL